jgi:hypothetical protein
MIYSFSLQSVGITVGVLLLLGHAVAWVGGPKAMAFAKDFPRSRAAATILLMIAAVWAFLLVQDIDLGEFSRLRQIMLMGIVAGAILAWLYVEEFLAARALGMLLLLAAEVLLESAVLRSEPSRLLLVTLAYGWVLAGLFMVGMPYLLRDAIKVVTASPTRWKLACLGGVAYGAALLVCAILFW